MTAPTNIDPARFLHEQLDQASPDVMRHLGLSLSTPAPGDSHAASTAPDANVAVQVKPSVLAYPRSTDRSDAGLARGSGRMPL
jgi:hypothetical protein